MNLNDPFNRLSRKQQNEYLAFCASLKESSINSQSELEDLLRKVKKRALFFSLFIVVLAILIFFLMPKLKMMLIIFTVLALLWMLSNTLKGHSYIKRYMKQEYSDTP